MLAPTAYNSRNSVLDVTRGAAILLIFFLNLPDMGNSQFAHFGAIRLLGWTPADQVCWWILTVFIQGTQRGLLQVLFGAGALILLRDTMRPDGPVQGVDLYFRRNLLLMLFGLADVFGALWYGDVLLAYGIAAIAAFPLRKLGWPTLLVLVFLFLGQGAVRGSLDYTDQARTQAVALEATQKQTAHLPLTAEETTAVQAHQAALAQLYPAASRLKAERDARFGTVREYAGFFYGIWFKFLIHGGILAEEVIEALFGVLLGMALYKLGIVQGRRDVGVYVVLGACCYGFGLSERVFAAWQQTAYDGSPTIAIIGGQAARFAMTVGHVCLINLLMKTASGVRLLSPLRAAGRTAFTLYILQNVLGDWILFPGFGFGLWGRYGWFGLTVIGCLVLGCQLILANIWFRWFAVGPLEWIWRSLAYQHRQPFLRASAVVMSNS